MVLHLRHVLSERDFRQIDRVFGLEGAFEDGRKTAGARARQVKNNEQARPTGLAADAVKLIEKRLLANEIFVAAARPKRIVRLLLSRYRPGMAYGRHVDEPLMDGIRVDLSFTLFLSAPETYRGGELVIEETGGERAVKLDRGDAVLYPSGDLHRVDPVTEGERRAAVGWVRSHVRDAKARETLFDLSVLRRRATLQGDQQQVDGLDKVIGDLLRRWAED